MTSENVPDPSGRKPLTPGRLVATAIAVLFVFGPALTLAVGLRAEPFENRPLATAPDPAEGWDALDQLTPWAAEQLPVREAGVRAGAWADYYVFGTLPPAGVPGAARPPLETPDGSRIQAPLVVRGTDGHFFYGEDFDVACEDPLGTDIGLRRLGLIARLVEESGRTATFTVAPNKTAVDAEHLPRVVPHDDCAREGITRLNRRLDRLDDPRYVPIRAALAAADEAGTQVYWKRDTHWTTVGSALHARALADALDARLGTSVAESLTSEEFERTQVSDLAKTVSLNLPETAPAELLSTGGTVTPRPDSEEYDYFGQFPGPQRWTTTGGEPGSTLPGRTLIIGDSFTYYGLENYRPLIGDGVFLWDRNTPDDQDFIDEIVAADTVVISTAQRNVPRNKLIRSAFIDRLRAALDENPR